MQAPRWQHRFVHEREAAVGRLEENFVRGEPHPDEPGRCGVIDPCRDHAQGHNGLRERDRAAAFDHRLQADAAVPFAHQQGGVLESFEAVNLAKALVRTTRRQRHGGTQSLHACRVLAQGIVEHRDEKRGFVAGTVSAVDVAKGRAARFLDQPVLVRQPRRSGD